MLAPIADGETVAVTTRLTGYRKVMARRETEVAGPTGEPRAVVLIDWAMTDGRAPVRIPVEFERAPIDGPGPFTPIRVDLPPSPPGATALRFTPRLRELDPMNHANNGVYLDWLDEAVAAAGADGDAATAAPPAHLPPRVPAPGGARRGARLRRPGATARAGPTAWPTRTGRISSGESWCRDPEPRKGGARSWCRVRAPATGPPGTTTVLNTFTITP